MRAYLDSSALVKRVADEAGADGLRAAVDVAGATGMRFVTSALARVEVGRAVRARLDAASPSAVAAAGYEAFIGVSVADLTRPILESARVIGPPVLRSLDAIHVATAIAAGVDELWTYDHRMAEVAEGLGVRVRVPG